MASFVRVGDRYIYKPTGHMRGVTFSIENAGLLDNIAEATGYSVRYLTREAALAAFDLADDIEDLLDEAIKGKVRIEVTPAMFDQYLVEATVLTEPSVRRGPSRSTIMVSRDEPPKRRYTTLKEAPSITAYVARSLHVAKDKAIMMQHEKSSQRVNALVLEAYEKFGVNIQPVGHVRRAPVGGIEYAGKFYRGGQFVPRVQKARAPAGGIEVGGKFYKGGQFVPFSLR